MHVASSAQFAALRHFSFDCLNLQSLVQHSSFTALTCKQQTANTHSCFTIPFLFMHFIYVLHLYLNVFRTFCQIEHSTLRMTMVNVVKELATSYLAKALFSPHHAISLQLLFNYPPFFASFPWTRSLLSLLSLTHLRSSIAVFTLLRKGQFTSL